MSANNHTGMMPTAKSSTDAALIAIPLPQTVPGLVPRTNPIEKNNGGVTSSQGARKLKPPSRKAVNTTIVSAAYPTPKSATKVPNP